MEEITNKLHDKSTTHVNVNIKNVNHANDQEYEEYFRSQEHYQGTTKNTERKLLLNHYGVWSKFLLTKFNNLKHILISSKGKHNIDLAEEFKNGSTAVTTQLHIQNSIAKRTTSKNFEIENNNNYVSMKRKKSSTDRSVMAIDDDHIKLKNRKLQNYRKSTIGINYLYICYNNYAI